MYTIQLYDNISQKGLDRFPSSTYIGSEYSFIGEHIIDAIILRSFNLNKEFLHWNPKTWPRLKAVGRAGIGVNNIPIDKFTSLGIPVFNTPGANANAVKELVIAGLFLATRNICQAWDYVQHMEGTDEEIKNQVEIGKKKFRGLELPGRILGVIGLGNTGGSIANAGVALGMNVIGYDNSMTEKAWEIDDAVHLVDTINEVLEVANFVTIHIPLTKNTRHLINERCFERMRNGVIVLNFARKEIIDEQAICKYLRTDKIHTYVCDFPSNALKEFGPRRVITLPHLGASTEEAEENCATMVVDQVKNFLDNGNIHNSVNFPDMVISRKSPYRLTVANVNVPNTVSSISSVLGNYGINIEHMINRSRQQVAYTIIDTDKYIPEEVKEHIYSIPNVLMARTFQT